MSAYAIDLICWRVVHDQQFREAMQRDARAAIDGAELSAEEREALLGADVGRLYRLGAHPFLLQQLVAAGVFGLTKESYSERMRAEPLVDLAREPGY